MTRLLPMSLILLAALTAATLSLAQAPAKIDTTSGAAADQLGWQLAVHTYTFRKFPVADAIAKTQSLGINYMSISGSVNYGSTTARGTTSLKPEELENLQKQLKDAGIVKLVNMGVVQLPADEAKSRPVFEFAKKAGIDTLVSEPDPAALDTIEKLCKEYNIKVAIHNHPKPSRYWSPDTVLEVVKGRSPLIGACADTGHWVRSGLDPLEAVKKLEGRILALHFKDLNEKSPKAHDVPWGTGVGNVKAIMAELKRQGFKGAFCIEYEHNWDNSVPEIAGCVKFFHATCAELAK